MQFGLYNLIEKSIHLRAQDDLGWYPDLRGRECPLDSTHNPCYCIGGLYIVNRYMESIVLLQLLCRLYAGLLLLYPRSFRAQFGAEMQQVFAELLRRGACC